MIYNDIQLNKSVYIKYHLPHYSDLYIERKLSLNYVSQTSKILIRKRVLIE